MCSVNISKGCVHSVRCSSFDEWPLWALMAYKRFNLQLVLWLSCLKSLLSLLGYTSLNVTLPFFPHILPLWLHVLYYGSQLQSWLSLPPWYLVMLLSALHPVQRTQNGGRSVGKWSLAKPGPTKLLKDCIFWVHGCGSVPQDVLTPTLLTKL